MQIEVSRDDSTQVIAENLSVNHPELLEIYTLGKFYVKKGIFNLSDKSRRSAKLWEFFKFLITNRNKSIPCDAIIESLWPEQEYNDQRSSLHTLTHRMRKLFYEEFSFGKKPFSLNVSQGCYCMELNDNCWLDVDEFERLSQQALGLARLKPESALDIYRRALSLYRGEYLPHYSFKKWLFPAKRHYRNLYLQILLGKIDLLMKLSRYDQVCQLSEKAFQIEQFIEVEALHLCFMKALFNSGKSKEALSHYDYLTSTLYQEFGTVPSTAMRDLYRRLKSDFGITGLDLTAIDENLKENETVKGSFVCDQDFFRFLYRLEMRRSERLEQEVVLGLFNISWDDYCLYNKKSLNQAMDLLEEVLVEILRKGDVITRWCESQYLTLLSGVSRVQANSIFKRINSTFSNRVMNKSISLKISRKSRLLEQTQEQHTV